MTTDTPFNSPIHAAKRITQDSVHETLLLRQLSSNEFQWFIRSEEGELETSMIGISPEQAIQSAWKAWKKELEHFRMILCGYRYSLPDRDEHGMPALFHQMVKSYSTPNGIYFDSEFGHNCIVQNASQEALELWRELREEAGVEPFPKPAQKHFVGAEHERR